MTSNLLFRILEKTCTQVAMKISLYNIVIKMGKDGNKLLVGKWTNRLVY